jgi:hypothetical protein
MKLLRITFCIVLAAAIWLLHQNIELKRQLESMRLPSQLELQQMLIDRGAPIEADGVIGKESRFWWDKFKFNEFAEVHAQAAGMRE